MLVYCLPDESEGTMGEGRYSTLILLTLLLTLAGCQFERGGIQYGGSHSMEPIGEAAVQPSVIALFAHPDDETWISGTLAKFARHGVSVFPVYATSGEAGSDHSGQGLSGAELAGVRELEAMAASHILGLEKPQFLRFPDGELNQYPQEVVERLTSLVELEKPVAVITFTEGGITDNQDHKTLNQIVSAHFNQLAGYFGVSYSRAGSLAMSANKFDLDYEVAMPVEDAAVTIRVDVSEYRSLRVEAMASHRTQFTPTMIQAFSDYADSDSQEEIIIADEQSRTVIIGLLK
ncbi:PIG-L deacetylase family protein [Shewanella atlantica]|uniref:PIG-L deacetylase family protein n=1 Tax=Shewanella atlantica TaxID=271099 RepID=UPI0037369D92